MKTPVPALTTKSRYFSPLLLLLLVTLLIRGSVLFSSLNTFNDDPDAYAQLADNWNQYGVFGNQDQATAFRPPLYPWTLKELKKLQKEESSAIAPNSIHRFFNDRLALSKNASIALWHWLLGLCTVALVYRTSLYAGLTPLQSSLAGFLVAVDPILLQQSRFVMTETLAAFFASAMLLFVVTAVRIRKSKYSFLLFLLLGGVFGLSSLCRPAFFAFTALVFLTLTLLELTTTLKAKKTNDKTKQNLIRAVLRLGFFLLGVASISIPWFLRNLREFDSPILTTTHGGYTLYLANNPEIYEHFRSDPAWSFWDPHAFHERRLIDYQDALKANNILEGSKEAELFQNEWTKQEAYKTISSDPKTFLYSCFIRVGELWRTLPHDVEAELSGQYSSPLKQALRYGIAIFYAFELLLALVAVINVLSVIRKHAIKFSFTHLCETPFIWGVLLILSVQGPHLIYWTNMRMRAPLETFIPILTILGLKIIKKTLFSKETTNP